jgi:hypothetical protein
MKTSILILSAVLLLSFTACGQSDNKVPEAVKSSFSQKFSNATNVKWDKENDNEWEAEFKMDGIKYSANFDNSGAWSETEYQISISDIPEAVKTTLNKESAGSKIEVSEVSETKDGKVYEFIISKGENKMELVIDNAGNIVKKKQSEVEEDDED